MNQVHRGEIRLISPGKAGQLLIAPLSRWAWWRATDNLRVEETSLLGQHQWMPEVAGLISRGPSIN